FYANIRQYNAVHAFTSLGVNIDQSVISGHAPYSFHIHGKLYHLLGALLPDSNNNVSYAQLYIYDPDIAHQMRIGRNNNLCSQTMSYEEGTSESDLAVRLHFSAITDRCRYNLPTANEIAVILPANAQYCFSILWSEDNDNEASYITQMNFYSFRLFSRRMEFSTILHGRKLLQEFLDTLRADVYQGLADIIGNTENEEMALNNLGRYIILPLSHIGSSRNIKIRTAADVDNVVCAEFPDQEADPILFNTILRCMDHGPCGARNPRAPCIENNMCQKRYPKDFQIATSMDADGYQLYARSDNGQTFNVNDRQKTTLTAFFEACTTIQNKNSKKWTIRKRGFAIGRLYFADPSAGERFNLRLLLINIRGPQSFDHLKTVNNITYSTFKSACMAIGLLEDDNEWIQCLEEASVMCSGLQLRSLFAIILIQCAPTLLENLWTCFRTNICDDLCH
ncbi:11328_t:CDS:2, partial [Cetraspora pellucida]